jgi:hypothetical protein
MVKTNNKTAYDAEPTSDNWEDDQANGTRDERDEDEWSTEK